MAAAGEGNGVVKGQGRVGQLNLNGMGLEEGGHLRLLLFGHHGNDLQHLIRITGHQTGSNGGRDTLEAAGIGDNDALHVFHQVAADLDGDAIGETAQRPAGHRRAVGQGDGFGTAHGGHQLFPQDLQVGLIVRMGFIHSNSFFPHWYREMEHILLIHLMIPKDLRIVKRDGCAGTVGRGTILARAR